MNPKLPTGWREMKLGDVYDIAAGGDLNVAEYSPDPDEFYPFPVYSNALKNKGLYGYSKRAKCDEDAITITARGDIGFANHRKTKFVAIGRLLVLKKRIPIFNEFVCEYINYKVRFSKEITGVPQLTAPQASNYRVVVPPLPEQKAIAGILQKWDEAIEKTEALISAKQKQFKGFSELFIGKKQYMNEGTKGKLGDLFRIYSYPSKNKSISSNGERVIVDMGAVSRTGDLIASKRTNINEDILQVNDLVMPKDDIGGGNIIGKVAIIDVAGKYVCGDHVYRLVQKGGIDASYFRFLINCYPVNKRLRASANGTSQLGLSKHDVAKQQVCFPSLPEQKRIAHVLNTTQREIGLLKQLADRYRTQKRGLMQKLLTGEWRVSA